MREIPECQYDDIPAFTGKAEYFDRPRTPFAFSDPTVYHASSPSILGFVASQAGEYVADVILTGARLTIHNPDLEIGDDAQNLGGTWEVQYEAPAGDPGPTVTAQLPLGHLSQGLHDLPYRLLDLSTAPGEHFAISIRLAESEAPPQTAPPPPPQETAPSPPPPSTPPEIAVAGTEQRSRVVRVTATRATALVRRALAPGCAAGLSRAWSAGARPAPARRARSPPVAGASAFDRRRRREPPPVRYRAAPTAHRPDQPQRLPGRRPAKRCSRAAPSGRAERGQVSGERRLAVRDPVGDAVLEAQRRLLDQDP